MMYIFPYPKHQGCGKSVPADGIPGPELRRNPQSQRAESEPPKLLFAEQLRESVSHMTTYNHQNFSKSLSTACPFKIGPRGVRCHSAGHALVE